MARQNFVTDERAEGNKHPTSTLEHAPNKVFQDEAGPSSPFSRRLLFSLFCILIYVLLDRSTVYLQLWPDISAWYPPTGLSVALMVGLGAEILPALLVASFLSGYINYHQSLSSPTFWLLNPMVPLVYAVASLYLRRKLSSHFRVRSTRDVTHLLGVSLFSSLVTALGGAGILVWTGEVPSPDFAQAAFNWWIGDAVALSSVTPFLLEYALPYCRRCLGIASSVQPETPPKTPIQARAELLESLGFGASIGFLVYLAFLDTFARNAHLFYLFFLPLIWMALRRGLRGAVVGLILVDSGLAVMMHVTHQGIEDLAILQFLMLILSLTALLLGAVIGERREAQRRLAEEEERIRLLLDSTAEGIYGVDGNGICTFINPAAVRLLGFSSRNEILGENFHFLCHHSFTNGTQIPTEACNIYEVFRSGQGVHRDDEIFWRRDGSSFPVEYWSHPLVRDGQILGCVVTFLDISQRRAFELAIRESEQRFRAVFEGAEMGITITDVKDGRVAANAAYHRMLGCTSEEMRSLAIFNKLTHPDDLEADIKAFQRLVSGEMDHLHADKRYLLRNARLVWASVELSVLRDAAGKPQYILGLAADITDRKRAEEELRARERQLLTFIEDAPVAVAMFDLQMCYLAASRRWLENYGLENSKYVGISHYETFPDLPQAWRAAHRRGLAGEKQYCKEDNWVRSDGVERWVSWALHPWYDPHGNIGGIIIASEDISQRKQFEIQLKDAKRAAEAASEAKSTFLATMSHEIRTPLNGILGLTELVLDTNLTRDQRENLSLVRLSAESLLTIINDILDFSKIEAGKLEVESIPFRLRETIEVAIKPFAIRARRKGLQFELNVPPEIPDALLGDPGRLRQILLNLIGNAIKFTEHGHIHVNICASFPATDRTLLHFSVEDTGIGVPPEMQEKIFAAFAQADGSMARKYGGTGLGLTICLRLVQMMGGKIWVESVPDRGSIFHFTLDLGVQDECAASAGNAAQAQSGVPFASSSANRHLPVSQVRGCRVLIVEDNAVNRTLAHRLLRKRGFDVSLAMDGKQALLAIQKADFDLILMDVQMPEMDGFEATAEIRKREKLAGKHTPIIALTAHAMKEDRDRCLSAGMDAYVTKPIRPDELFRVIHDVLAATPVL